MRRALLAVCLSLLLLLPTTRRTQAAGLNLFPWGECTFWAAQMRPDLLGVVWGDAKYWAYEARIDGYRVSDYPAVGSIAVFQPGVQLADGFGHVAYVTALGNAGWFQVSEMHFPWLGTVTRRWAHTGYGVLFIWWR